jgi:hypothetical protein
VTGIVWIMNASDTHWEFTASIPQKMLRRRRTEPVITELTLDEQRQWLSCVLTPKASVPSNGEGEDSSLLVEQSIQALLHTRRQVPGHLDFHLNCRSGVVLGWLTEVAFR